MKLERIVYLQFYNEVERSGGAEETKLIRILYLARWLVHFFEWGRHHSHALKQQSSSLQEEREKNMNN